MKITSMKTLKDLEKEFNKRYKEFCETYGVMFTMTSTYGSLEDGIKQFYRQSLTECLEELVGEDAIHVGISEELDGYNNAKAEIRQRIKSFLGE